MKLPIRARLTVVYCVVFCACMLALEGGAYFVLGSSVDSLVDRELQARLNGIVDFVEHHIAKFAPARFQSELKQHGALQPDLLAIFDANGVEVFQATAMRAIATGLRPSKAVFSWTAGHLRILTARHNIQGRDYDLYLATDITVPVEVMRRFRWILLLSAPVILACASLAGYWISGRALAPVSGLIRAARTIGAANLSQRVVTPASGDEIEELAVTLNGMLTRIENAFRQVTQFTADASHELRTPLAVIRATSEVALLRPTGNAESYREALHRILREAEKNTTLLDNLLRLARADSTAGALHLRPLSLSERLAHACERMQLLAREKSIALEVHTSADDMPDVAGDAEHILRLCLILLDNAIKYTPAGGSITALVHRANPAIRLEVRDTGIGISEQDLPRIFGRFYRADQARSKDGGAGLGLAIAQRIVEAHHAEIRVASTPGIGSVFMIDFPALASGKAAEHFSLTL